MYHENILPNFDGHPPTDTVDIDIACMIYLQAFYDSAL